MLETRLRTFADNTGGGSGSSSTAGLVSSSLTVDTTYPLSGGGNLSANRTFFVMTGGAGQVLITSGGVTGDLVWVNTLGGAAGSVYAATGNNYAVLNLAADLTAEYRLVQSGNSITIDTTGNLIIINAATGVVTSTAGLTQSSLTISTTYPLSGGGNLSVNRTFAIQTGGAGQVLITSGGVTGDLAWVGSGGGGSGSGTVNTGSANYLTYYPAAGTTVDDAPISISTGGGIAPFNIAILTAPVASIASGDFWFVSSNNVMYLGVRSSTINYFIAMDS